MMHNARDLPLILIQWNAEVIKCLLHLIGVMIFSDDDADDDDGEGEKRVRMGG